MKKLLMISTLFLSFLSAGVELDDDLKTEIISKHCDVEKVKKLIKQGANKDLLIIDEDVNAFVYSAAIGDKKCAEVAKYLSSKGAKDVGLAKEHYAIHKYKKAKVFETKHLRLSIMDVDISGGTLNAILENKTDEPIYMKGQSVNINGVKDFIDNVTIEDLFIEIPPHNATKDRDYHLYSPLSFCDGNISVDDKNVPRVVNNKITLVRQYTLRYEHKEKLYELKTPTMKEKFEVKYAPYNLLDL